MSQTTFANGRGIVHQDSGGSNTVFPDVCLTPVGNAIVPIPYINIGESKNTSDGPKSVTVDKKMPMVKGAKYPNSSGDEAGSKGGVISAVNQDECEFMLYSFDIKFEGRHVCRLGDPMLHNRKNSLG